MGDTARKIHLNHFAAICISFIALFYVEVAFIVQASAQKDCSI
jgi:hypothetical protein